MPFHAIVGGQRGDEGKGRFVDLFAADYSVVARGNGGSNAGHTVVPESMQPIALHQIPSGIAYPDKLNIIGNGVYVDPRRLANEIEALRQVGMKVTAKNLLVSDTAHLVMPHHLALDALREGSHKAQGSTQSGIAYVAGDKYLREGLRLESVNNPKLLFDHAYEALQAVNQTLPAKDQRSAADLKQEIEEWVKAVQALESYISDTVEVINERLEAGEAVLGEGAQAFWLDINHGMYPSVTSSSTTVGGLLDGLGVSAKHLNRVSLVVKSVKSHVGGGPFVTEITDEVLADHIRGKKGITDSEYGATTKRPRRIGYPDLVELKNAIRVNGADEILLTKLDHVPRYGNKVKIATAYQYQGKSRLNAPGSAVALYDCQPEYVELPTWEADISDVRDFSKLPKQAATFVKLFEDELGLPISQIGVGAERNQVIRV
ncbi:MAG TPA: adenylosuccinate synthetase [Candidatus Saccharimonadales bacterium]|jgi:adenylosuccinate synthase|nr:adenylosuccinate synthetase [Candidatus Saccharimonadales bacterium]